MISQFTVELIKLYLALLSVLIFLNAISVMYFKDPPTRIVVINTSASTVLSVSSLLIILKIF